MNDHRHTTAIHNLMNEFEETNPWDFTDFLIWLDTKGLQMQKPKQSLPYYLTANNPELLTATLLKYS